MFANTITIWICVTMIKILNLRMLANTITILICAIMIILNLRMLGSVQSYYLDLRHHDNIKSSHAWKCSVLLFRSAVRHHDNIIIIVPVCSTVSLYLSALPFKACQRTSPSQPPHERQLCGHVPCGR